MQTLEADRHAEEYQQQEAALIDDYLRFLRFESVSADPGCREQTRACAKFVADYLKDAGMTVETFTP